MLKGLLAFLAKGLLHAILWVFILSIRWDGRTLFDHMHDVLVDNSLVESIDTEVSDIFSRVQGSIAKTFSSEKEEEAVY